MFWNTSASSVRHEEIQILKFCRWVESDAMYQKMGRVGCYVPEDGLGRILCTWRWVGSDAMYLKMGWVGCYVPEDGLGRILCTWRWVGSDTMSLDAGKCHHWSHRISPDNRGRNSRPKIIHINSILKLNRFPFSLIKMRIQNP